MKYAKRRKWQGIGRKIVLLILLTLLPAIFLFGGKRSLWEWYRLQQQCAAMERQNDSLELKIHEYNARIKAISAGDSLEIERVARFWGMVRSGEEIYIIRDKNDSLRTEP